jgi:hypothetical protein
VDEEGKRKESKNGGLISPLSMSTNLQQIFNKYSTNMSTNMTSLCTCDHLPIHPITVPGCAPTAPAFGAHHLNTDFTSTPILPISRVFQKIHLAYQHHEVGTI